MAANPLSLTSTEVADIAGITYRQLDYWVRHGWVTPAGHGTIGNGCGIREWDADATRQVTDIAALTRLGFRPERAAEMISRKNAN